MNKVIIRRDSMNKSKNVFETRFCRHLDELKWLYMELYGNDAMFADYVIPWADFIRNEMKI